jgi:hypothetical protein
MVIAILVVINGRSNPVQEVGNRLKLTKPAVTGLFGSSKRKTKSGLNLREYRQANQSQGDRPF